MPSIRTITGRAISYAYDVAQSVTEAISVGVTIYNQSKNITIAGVGAMVTGVQACIATEGFMGPVIRAHAGGEALPDYRKKEVATPGETNNRRKFYQSAAISFTLLRCTLYGVGNY